MPSPALRPITSVNSCSAIPIKSRLPGTARLLGSKVYVKPAPNETVPAELSAKDDPLNPGTALREIDHVIVGPSARIWI